jgi:hypothetical protein
MTMLERRKSKEMLQGARVLILTGEFQGKEGVCLGEQTPGNKWAVSPDGTDQILSLAFEKEFALLVDLSANPKVN